MNFRLAALLAALLLISSVVLVNAQAPTSYTFKIFAQGATSPISTTTLPASGFTCGVTPKIPAPTGPVTNPKRLAYDDPAAPTSADCIFTDSGTGPLLALPFGTQLYTATLAIVNAAGTSPDGVSVNSFTRPGIIAPAPAGFRVTP